MEPVFLDLTDPTFDVAGPGHWLPVSGNTGAISFPITFTPSPRVGSAGRG